MEYAKNSDCRFGDGVSGDVRRTVDDEFACPGNSTHAPAGRKVELAADGGYYPFMDQNSGCRIICLDECEDGVAVRQRIRRSSKLHDSGAPALRRAAVRRFAKCASTSSSDKSSRKSFNASSTLVRNQASYSSLAERTSRGRAASLAVRVSIIRTASDTVRPCFQAPQECGPEHPHQYVFGRVRWRPRLSPYPEDSGMQLNNGFQTKFASPVTAQAL